MSKLIEYHRGYVTDFTRTFVWVVLGDNEWRLTIRQFNKMFGRAHRQRGRIVEVWIRARRGGKKVVWGKPYLRKWTQADIDRANREGTALWERLHARNTFE